MGLVNGQSLDILGLTETWQRPHDRFVLPLEYIALTSPVAGNRYRGHAGVAMTFREGLLGKSTKKYQTEDFMVLTCLVGELWISLLYIFPSCPPSGLTAAMEVARRNSPGPALIMGDFNARHRNWDTQTNSKGTELLRWTQFWGWQIDAAGEPSFHNQSGSSNVDLFLRRGCDAPISPWIPRGIWDGASDHSPVSITISYLPTCQPRYMETVPYWKRSCAETKELAQKAYALELPRLALEAQDAGSKAELDQVYSVYQELTTRHWVVRRRIRPRRFQPFWTAELDRTAKERSKAYKKAKRSMTDRNWRDHSRLNRKIKRMVREAKQRVFQAFTDRLGNSNPQEAQGVVTRILRAKQGYVTEHTAQGHSLDRACFTQHKASSSIAPREVQYNRRPFNAPETTVQAILAAITKMPRKKAPGPDLIVSEALQAAPEQHAEFLFHLWNTCGRLRALPTEWLRSIICPIYKKGAPDLPENYRPIALLSHVRKVLEKMLDARLRETYTFHRAQLGFRPCQGTEIAILRTLQSQSQGDALCAILDLKAAYPSVPRDILIRELHRRVPSDLANQVEYFLQPTTFYTAGDPEKKEHTLERGVPQGSPLSPALYNLFMDTFPEQLLQCEQEASEPIIMFADDVQLRAKSRRGLQQLLDQAACWAQSMDMTWSIGKCSVIRPSGPPDESLTLNGQSLNEKTEDEYLGISLDAKGVNDTTFLKRVQNAKTRLNELRRVGLNNKGFAPSLNRRLFQTFVRTKVEYQVHITPLSTKAVLDYHRLERKFFEAASGVRSGRLPWWRKVFQIEPLEHRRTKLREGLVNRLQSLNAHEASVSARALAHAGNDKPHKEAHEYWDDVQHSCTRVFPATPIGTLPPVLLFASNKYRSLGLQWFLHRFPRSPAQIVDTMGDSGRAALSSLLLLQKQTLTQQEEQRVYEAIDQITDETD